MGTRFVAVGVDEARAVGEQTVTLGLPPMSKPQMSCSHTSGMPSSLQARLKALTLAMPPR